jgi:hypothetical protein
VPRTAIADPVAHLAGRWTVERELHDRRSGVRGRFDGTAEFIREGAGLRWTEEGVLTFGRHRGPARRALRIVPAGKGWEVRFADGRAFHALDLAGGRAVVEHPCGEDLYTGAYEADGPDALVVRWHVTGPAKDLLIVSRYGRGAPGASVAPDPPADVEAGRGRRSARAVDGDRVGGAPG